MQGGILMTLASPSSHSSACGGPCDGLSSPRFHQVVPWAPGSAAAEFSPVAPPGMAQQGRAAPPHPQPHHFPGQPHPMTDGACMHAKLFQSCLTLCDPTDCSLPGSSVHEVLQIRILEGVAMSSSRNLFDLGLEPASHVSCTGRQVL